VLSGQAKGAVGYGQGDRNSWTSLPGDLEKQRDYTLDFYTLLFSHPAVEAITWWDFCDNQWLNAPGGLLTENLEPKPVYHALRDLIKGQWWSRAAGRADGTGVFSARVFCGAYHITVSGAGRTVTVGLEIPRDRGRSGPKRVLIRL
jgi:hypothetical protein